MNIEIPNLIIIGDVSYDTNKFYYEDGTSEIRTNYGGSSVYASVPASIFFRVGLVSNAGEDIDVSKLTNFNIDLKGLHQRKNERTTRFYNILRTKDRQERETRAEYNTNLATKFEDIPPEYLSAKYFYIATMPPAVQADIIRRKNVFDLVDIAFIDKEFESLLNCNAKTKIIKLGKTGCILQEGGKYKRIHANVIENVVDKTGAGDCLNGVFMNLIANGNLKENALQKAVEIATMSIKDFGILKIKERLRKELDCNELEH